jgi:hypothetical protein
MNFINRPPPLGAARVSEGTIPGRICTSDIAPTSEIGQADYAPSALKINAAVQAANLVSISTKHFCRNVEEGDFVLAQRNLATAVTCLLEACTKFREWRDLPTKEAGQ